MPTFTYVYLLETQHHPSQNYIGITTDLATRLAYHNSGRCPHTAAERPWFIRTAAAFNDPTRATAFERYLKSHSGRSFSKRHF